MPNPEVYTEGLGELIRAKRLYTGLSKDGFAKQLNNMAPRSYERIENGERPCPAGLLDAVDAVLDRFDDAVEAMTGALPDSAITRIEVDARPRNEWNRVVASRAAVETSRIMPILVGDYRGGNHREASSSVRRSAVVAAQG